MLNKESPAPMPAPPLVLVAPSGTGKTTVARALTERHPDRFTFSVSATTREPRSGEVDGKDYQFVTEEDFRSLIEKGQLAEWATVHGNYYGTPLSALAPDQLGQRTPVLDIDVQGAQQVQARIAAATVIFLLPPTPDVWIDRLTGRGTEAPAEIRLRLETALTELQAAPQFRDFVVNGVLEEAVDDIVGVLNQDLHSGLSSLKAEELCEALRVGAQSWIGEVGSPEAGAKTRPSEGNELNR